MSKINLHKIILFDGVCNLCNGFVQFVIKKEKKNTFKFAALQSEIAQKLLNDYGLSSKKIDSIVLIDVQKERTWTESSAALQIMKELKGPYSWLYAFIILPKFIRDAVYKIIAKNRYRWFGKEENCMIPTAELRDKFLHN